MTELEKIHQRLLAPLPLSEMSVRPGNRSGEKAKVLFYLNPRSVQRRLDTVFGPSGWSSPSVKIFTNQESDSNLLISCTVTLAIHTEEIARTVTNTGEKGGKDSQHNKTTSAHAQAFKRAASLLGIGTYLYYLDIGYKPLNGSKFASYPQPTDEDMESALSASGFKGICEETGEKVPWKIAAHSMERLGRVLSKDKARELLGS